MTVIPRGPLMVLAIAAVLMFTATSAPAAEMPASLIETPMLVPEVAAGTLPPVGERLPEEPSVVALDGPGLSPGRHGGDLRTIMGRAKDTRMLVVYGYSRLVGYDRDLRIVPDILESVEVEEGRVFTLHLRKGHKWSDGQPFTSEDFRYYWEDVALDEEMSPAGVPQILKVDNELPIFEVIDETTVRYEWAKPNPFFLPGLAAALPLYIHRPAHYLKQFHARYAEAGELAAKIEEAKQRNWVALHFRKGRQYRNDNPDLPTLQPWVLATKPPSERFQFLRNPYFHRVDTNGRQLPYLDRVIMVVASAKLIPAKAGAGETDLQARGISFNNYTFLKQGEKRNDYSVRLWQMAAGSQMALYPNLNINDPAWRALFREVDFRRALSLAIDRHEINQVIYFGLAREGNNTVLPQSPLFDERYQNSWALFDLGNANRLLDGLGLTDRDSRGVRLLPDGRPLEIIVETAGESVEESDALELIHDSWLKVGIKLYTKPSQREVMRNRVYAGTTQMSVWKGLENGIPTPDLSPDELAPMHKIQLQWTKWGQYEETNGQAGEPIDMEPVKRLAELNEEWRYTGDDARRREIWHEMLGLHAEYLFTIGLVNGVKQPVVVSNRLRNVPVDAIYNWNPGAHFGMYRPDTFWFSDAEDSGERARLRGRESPGQGGG